MLFAVSMMIMLFMSTVGQTAARHRNSWPELILADMEHMERRLDKTRKNGQHGDKKSAELNFGGTTIRSSGAGAFGQNV